MLISLCANSCVCPSGAQRFCKNDSDSSYWLWFESSHSVKNVARVDSSHHFSQCNSSRVRVIQNRDSIRVTLSLHTVRYAWQPYQIYLDMGKNQWWSLETWSQSRSRRSQVSVSKDFGLGLELFVLRLCIGYFLWSFARSSLKNGFIKGLFKIYPFKEVSAGAEPDIFVWGGHWRGQFCNKGSCQWSV